MRAEIRVRTGMEGSFAECGCASLQSATKIAEIVSPNLPAYLRR